MNEDEKKDERHQFHQCESIECAHARIDALLELFERAMLDMGGLAQQDLELLRRVQRLEAVIDRPDEVH